MKALSILLLAMLVLAGCASPQMKEDDAFLWGDSPEAPASKPAAQ